MDSPHSSQTRCKSIVRLLRMLQKQLDDPHVRQVERPRLRLGRRFRQVKADNIGAAAQTPRLLVVRRDVPLPEPLRSEMTSSTTSPAPSAKSRPRDSP